MHVSLFDYVCVVTLLAVKVQGKITSNLFKSLQCVTRANHGSKTECHKRQIKVSMELITPCRRKLAKIIPLTMNNFNEKIKKNNQDNQGERRHFF